MATARTAPLRYDVVTKAFRHVGAQLWTCVRCGGRATYSRPLDLVPAEDPAGPYSHAFAHRGGCPA